MSYAQVTNNEITTISGRLPNRARRLDNENWIEAFPDASVALREACGWYEIVDVPRPADTATTTHDRSVEIVNGTTTVVWTARPKTQAELDAETAQLLDTATRDQARTAFLNNKTYLGITSPTNAQTLDQVKALTRQMNGLIRLIVDFGLVD